MNTENLNKPESSGAHLEHLTGPDRGKVSWLPREAVDLCTPGNHLLDMTGAGQCGSRLLLARLHPSGATFEVQSCEGSPLWVNGERLASRTLVSGDLIEFGEKGPLCRYHLTETGKTQRKTLGEIFEDYRDYFRVSRRPLIRKIARASSNMASSFATQTTLLFRAGLLLGLAFVLFNQFQASREFDRHKDWTATRLDALERQSEAARKVIQAAASSVVFLQGSYGYRETATGRLLRFAQDQEGRIARLPTGHPLVTLEGEGPVARSHFTGTAFSVANQETLISNRHVALPWEQDERLERMVSRGLAPEILAFYGYVPGTVDGFEVQLQVASDDADLAILQTPGFSVPGEGLIFSADLPAPGDPVIVMGYPTGLRALLARTGATFLDDLEPEQELDHKRIADELSSQGFISPLASLGIIAQVADAVVVYDAETTHGGSGGPVLNMSGQVVAVNAAIIPGYTGSNIGVPVKFAAALIEGAEQ